MGGTVLQTETGDKVRLKAGEHRDRRGVVVAVEGARLAIRLEGEEVVVRAGVEDVTNFSLAARKAWKTEPNRGVGRRKGTRLCDRVSVTLRLDRELWERFVQLEEAGLIEERTATVNRWFREKMAELEG
jgi:hypothetical protein